MEQLQIRLRELMKEQKMTQHDLASRLNIEEATLSKYLNSDRMPRIDILSNMATVLQTTVDYLLGNSENREFDYRGVKRLLARNAQAMTMEQKKQLIDVLLGE